MTSYIFIACQSHSGSTLLESLLATDPGCVSLGEIAHFAPYYDHPDQRCGCGATFPECPFWSAVVARLGLRERPVNPGFPTDGFRHPSRARNALYHALIMSPPLLELAERLGESVALKNRESVQNHWRLMQAVIAETQARVLIDKSMSASRLLEIQRKAPAEFRMGVIHLVRDGRANAFSHRKLFGTAIRDTAAEWKRVNTRIEAALRVSPRVTRLLVRYEDLCRDPEQTLQKVVTHFELPARFEPTKIGGTTVHGVGGNYARQSRGYKKVMLDEAWRRGLMAPDLEAFGGIAGALNRRYGY
jgi:hypothetical protein